MMHRWTDALSSIRKTVIFWWILFVVMQMAERVFLLRDAFVQETPTPALLVKTLAVGVRGDFITATFALVLAVIVAAGWTLLRQGLTGQRPFARSFIVSFRPALHVSCLLFGLLLFVLLSIDMGYYAFNRQHMDFVFLEYVGDLFAPAATTDQTNAQALKQTGAELEATGKWAARVALFLTIEAVAVGLWCWGYSVLIVPALFRWRPVSGFQANALLCVCLIGGGAGFHPLGPYGIRIASIGSSVYYTLAQNPVLFASEALRVAWVSRGSMAQRESSELLPYDVAVRTAQSLLGPGQTFPDARYPMVRSQVAAAEGVRLDKPANVVILFVEGLDRRYLGRTYGEVRGTPFLDRLKDDSVYFSNFFSNGVQTSRGLFATLCSTYPRHGASAMKTRYAHDYLCLPSLLQRHGYSTEMVIGQHRDLNRLQIFLSRNGLEQMRDEGDFPPGTERAGLGIVDGALFDLCYERIKQRQAEGTPFFLTTLTLSTHHPFTVPLHHDEVRTLQRQVSDQYVGALRYTDLELERVFTKLIREGLLRNTIVVIVGDHGRHESMGSTEVERKTGHFASPMLIWMDESMRTPTTYRPRTVSTVASHVDVAPTLLALNGIAPALAPFAGHDLTCLLVKDCLPEHVAYLTSVYDNLVGLATRDGILLYSFLTERFEETSLAFEPLTEPQKGLPPLTASRSRDLWSLYEVSNAALDANRIWSWREFGARL